MSNQNHSDLDMVLVRGDLGGFSTINDDIASALNINLKTHMSGILMRIEGKEKEGNERTDTERPLNDLSLCNDIL